MKRWGIVSGADMPPARFWAGVCGMSAHCAATVSPGKGAQNGQLATLIRSDTGASLFSSGMTSLANRFIFASAMSQGMPA